MLCFHWGHREFLSISAFCLYSSILSSYCISWPTWMIEIDQQSIFKEKKWLSLGQPCRQQFLVVHQSFWNFERWLYCYLANILSVEEKNEINWRGKESARWSFWIGLWPSLNSPNLKNVKNQHMYEVKLLEMVSFFVPKWTLKIDQDFKVWVVAPSSFKQTKSELPQDWNPMGPVIVLWTIIFDS